MIRARVLAPALALAAAGCTHHRLDLNAPGHVSLELPADLSQREPEPPLDPGDQSIIIHPGGFLAGGGSLQGSSFTGSGVTGAQLSVLHGEYRRSAVSFLDFMIPEQALGGGVGYSYEFTTRTHRLHAELQAHFRYEATMLLRGMAAGVAWEPGTTNAFGLQATGTAGPLFMRANWFPGRLATVLIGVNADLTFALVWSR